MNANISFSTFNLKYLLYSILLLIIDIILYLFILNDSDENIMVKHKLLDASCLFFGCFLNIIPEYIINNNPDEGNLSIKDITKIIIINIFLLFVYTIQTIINKIEDEDNDNENLRAEYEDYFLFVEFFVIFIFSHSSEVYYKHQKLSFFIFSLTEIIKFILFISEKQFLNKIFIEFFANYPGIIFFNYFCYLFNEYKRINEI